MYYTIAEAGAILTSEKKKDESDPNITDNV
jgi:hypothetical protein